MINQPERVGVCRTITYPQAQQVAEEEGQGRSIYACYSVGLTPCRGAACVICRGANVKEVAGKIGAISAAT